MTKHNIIALLALLGCSITAAAQDTIRITARDVAANYDLQAEFIDDTAALPHWMQQHRQSYPQLSHICTNIAKSAQTMIRDLDADFHDGIVTFDERHIMVNYEQDRLQLLRIIDQANLLRHTYDSLEAQRISAEQEQARQKALAEERRKQAIKENELTQLRETIQLQHRKIAALCNDASVTDKTKLKELKDTYYAYLAVYNKYDLSSYSNIDLLTESNLELRDFQTHLRDSVLGENSYVARIARFKDELKIDSEKYPAIYRSYCKLFKRTSLPVNFANLDEYDQYIDKLKETIAIQQMYRLSVDELAKIDAQSETIATTYGKRYRDISSAYHTMVSSLDFTPAFLTRAQGIEYYAKLHEFQEVQQRYIANLSRLEKIRNRGDILCERNLKKHYDIVVSYRELSSNTSFIANFKTLDGADLYDEKLSTFETIQDIYESMSFLRDTIEANHNLIVNARSIDKILLNGYKGIRKIQNFSARFTTVAQGNDLINNLNAFILVQQQFLETISQRDIMNKNAEAIAAYEKNYPNIARAYARIAKSYAHYPIYNIQELEQYQRTLQRHISAQQIFIEAINSPDASSYNQQLKRVTDNDKIKLILKILQ